MEEKILHDPTQLLKIFQGMLCYAESIAESAITCTCTWFLRNWKGWCYFRVKDEGHFRAAVTVSKEGMVIMETGSVESVSLDFGDLGHHLRRYRKQLIVFNSKYTPRTREVWKLTITTVNVGNRVVGVVTPFINLLQPNEEFIKQRTNTPTLRGYKLNYCADWLGWLQMIVAPMRGCIMRP